jgi:hypothetical protein
MLMCPMIVKLILGKLGIAPCANRDANELVFGHGS